MWHNDRLHVSAIIVAGGRGARFGGERLKQFVALAGRPILQHSVDAFVRSRCIDDIVVALPGELVASPPAYLANPAKRIEVVEGGARRQDSVANAFARVDGRADVVVIHDAARPLVSDTLIHRTVDAAIEGGAAIAAMRASDTVKRATPSGTIAETLRRDEIYLAQTPQAFRVDVLRDALSRTDDATDEAMLAERAGHEVRLVESDATNLKVTTQDDLAMAERLLSSAVPVMRVGTGYDLHRLVAGRPLVLGGVTIPFEKGLEAHSDGDVVCHAVTDAILGAASAGDIGQHFPDTDAAWKDANSVDLLRRAADAMRDAGFAVVNVDVVVIAQRPKLLPHVRAMREHVAHALGCDVSRVSVKGKTNEGVDAVGAGEAIAVHAVALLQGM